MKHRAAAPTCELFRALAGEAALPAAAQAPIPARVPVAQVHLGLAVIPGEAGGAAAAQPVDGVDGSEEDGVGGDEGGQAVELEHGDALHVVLAGLAQADVVIEGQHALGGDGGQEAAVQVDPLLQVLGAEELATAAGQQDGQADVQNAGAHVRVVLDVEDDDVLLAGGEHRRHALQEEPQQRGQEALLGHVGQPQGDAAGEHLVRDDGDLQCALSRHAVHPIYKERDSMGYLFNIQTQKKQKNTVSFLFMKLEEVIQPKAKLAHVNRESGCLKGCKPRTQMSSVGLRGAYVQKTVN